MRNEYLVYGEMVITNPDGSMVKKGQKVWHLGRWYQVTSARPPYTNKGRVYLAHWDSEAPHVAVSPKLLGLKWNPVTDKQWQQIRKAP